MILDVTTKVSNAQMEQWLEKSEQRYITAGHIGTHLDTYEKTAIPLEYFKSAGVLVDVAHICETREVLVSDVEAVEFPPDSFVVFRTGRIDHFAYGTPEYFNDHPQLSHALIDWLLAKKIRFIGIDCAGIRRGDEHREADVRCEEKGVYVIENLCNLSLLQATEFTMYTMWLDDDTMTGLKCRVLAQTN